MKLWMTQGGRTAFRPSWLKMIAIWKHAHTVVHESFNDFMLTHHLTSSEGEHLLMDIYWPHVNSCSVASPISLRFISLMQNSPNTTASAAFIFNQHFLLSSLQFHLLLLVGKLLQLHVLQKGRTSDQHRWQSLYWIQACTMRTTEGIALCTNYTSSSPQLYFPWFGWVQSQWTKHQGFTHIIRDLFSDFSSSYC